MARGGFAAHSEFVENTQQAQAVGTEFGPFPKAAFTKEFLCPSPP